MPAPKGNQYWKMASRVGAKRAYQDPDVFFNECLKYFKWCNDNPLKEQKLFHSQGIVVKEHVEKMRMITIEGLCGYLRMSKETWYQQKKRPEFKETIEELECLIRDYNLTGASSEMLNPAMIAKYHGVVDKQQIELNADVKSKNETVTISTDMDPQQAADLYDQLIGKK